MSYPAEGLDVLKRLRKVDPGIHTIDDSISFDHDLPLVVAVHPFFLNAEEHNTDYPTRIFDFLDTYRGPILVLSEEELVRAAVNVYGVNPPGSRYIVSTELSCPDPVDMGWKELTDFIGQFGPHANLAGGFLDKDRFPVNRGCLGYFAHRLRRNGVTAYYLPELCFSRNDCDLTVRNL